MRRKRYVFSRSIFRARWHRRRVLTVAIVGHRARVDFARSVIIAQSVVVLGRTAAGDEPERGHARRRRDLAQHLERNALASTIDPLAHLRGAESRALRELVRAEVAQLQHALNCHVRIDHGTFVRYKRAA